jgi:putative spermidine/putrescine transport system substrate-binding protein
MHKKIPATPSFSRRDFLRLAGISGLAATSGGLLTACAPKQIELTHFIWVGGGQGVVPREVVPAYMEEHPNVTIELFEGTNSVTYPKMVAAKEADPNNPLINLGFFNIDATVKGTKDDMWVSLDPEKIPNMNTIDQSWWRPDNKGITWGLAEIGLIYNTDLVDEPPTSWLDLLDPKWRGQVVMMDYPFDEFLATVAHSVGDDVSNDDEAWNLITQAAADGQFLSFGTSNEDVKSPIVRGEALIAPWFPGMTETWVAEEGVPLAWVEPKEGFLAFPLFFQIVNGSTPEQIDVASDIINMYLEPDTLERYACLTKTPHTSSVAGVCEELQGNPLFDPAVIANSIKIDWDTVAERDVEWRDRWDREVKAAMP